MGKGFAILLVVLFLMSILVIVDKPVSGATAVVDSWVEKTPMNVTRAGLGVAVVNGKIYAIGGVTQTLQQTFPLMGFPASGCVGTNEQYDPTNNTWAFKAPMPTPRAQFAIFVYQNKIYCIGGITDKGPSTANEVYDPETNTWTSKTPAPGEYANVIDGKVYVIYGDITNRVYDPIKDSWTEMATGPHATIRWASTSLDNKMCVLGGVDFFGTGGFSKPAYSSNIIYSTETNIWTAGDSPPLTVFGCAAAATTGEFAPKRIYLLGAQPGGGESGQSAFPNQVYDPTQNTWTYGNSMPTGRTDLGIANINDTLYAIGGYTYTIKMWPGQGNSTGTSITNPITLSAANEVYIPIGYGSPDPSYVLEHVPPAISILSLENQTYDNSTISLFFNADKVINWTGYSLDGHQNITITGNIILTRLSNGVHNITVYANDTYGNMGASDNVSFTIKQPFPNVALAAISGGIIVITVVVAGLLVYFKKHRRAG